MNTLYLIYLNSYYIGIIETKSKAYRKTLTLKQVKKSTHADNFAVVTNEKKEVVDGPDERTKE